MARLVGSWAGVSARFPVTIMEPPDPPDEPGRFAERLQGFLQRSDLPGVWMVAEYWRDEVWGDRLTIVWFDHWLTALLFSLEFAGE